MNGGIQKAGVWEALRRTKVLLPLIFTNSQEAKPDKKEKKAEAKPGKKEKKGDDK